MAVFMVRPCKQVSRLLSNQLFWLLTFVLGWLAVITLLIAYGYGYSPHG